MKGYTRVQAAKLAGISVRSLDRYVKQGLVTGRRQYVPKKRSHMRVFTDQDIETLKSIYDDNFTRLCPGIQRHLTKRTT
jgi:DNA-binding transcriptional MerR regulator